MITLQERCDNLADAIDDLADMPLDEKFGRLVITLNRELGALRTDAGRSGDTVLKQRIDCLQADLLKFLNPPPEDHVGTHRPDEDQSHTGSLDVEAIGDIHVSHNGSAIVQFWVARGFLEEEAFSLKLTMTTHQRKRLIADLTKE